MAYRTIITILPSTRGSLVALLPCGPSRWYSTGMAARYALCHVVYERCRFDDADRRPTGDLPRRVRPQSGDLPAKCHGDGDGDARSVDQIVADEGQPS